MWRDPIVEEVRTAREKLSAKWLKKTAKFRTHQQKLLKEWPGRVVNKAQLDQERRAR